MSNKKITTEVSPECCKQLKILAVQKEMSLQKVVAEILEKVMSKKKQVVDDVTVE